MDAGLLDMLHDARDPNLASPASGAAVAERVHVNLDRVLEEAIQVDRPSRFELCPAEVVGQVTERVDDLHGPTTEYIARSHQQRKADVRSPIERLLEGSRGGIRGRLEPQPVKQRPEP